MQLIKTKTQLRTMLQRLRKEHDTIALVPTMGNLHQGHLELVKFACNRAGKVVVSIFVNPIQFDQKDDLERYPRTLEEDAVQLQALGVDILFAPNVDQIYPAGTDAVTSVEVPGISERLEGAARRGHFSGVATVVAKLFNLVRPDIAIFGEKDYQQLQVIKKMVADLDMPVGISSVATVREANGLAMSSRNRFLTRQERDLASLLYQTLQDLADKLLQNTSSWRDLEKQAAAGLNEKGFDVDYVSIARSDDLLPAEKMDKQLVILIAARLGATRLIDNLPVNLNTGE